MAHVERSGPRRIRSPPVSLEAPLPLASHLACAQVIDGTRQLLGAYGACRPLRMFVLQAREVWLGCRLGSEAQDGSCRQGPREMGLADFGACRAVPCPGGCPGPCD